VWAAVAEYGPVVVLTDIRLPQPMSDEDIRAARQIRAEHPAFGLHT
jgi:DNA-binding NarL/FixJ family response regulator